MLLISRNVVILFTRITIRTDTVDEGCVRMTHLFYDPAFLKEKVPDSQKSSVTAEKGSG